MAEYSPIDHHARFLYKIRLQFTKRRGSLIYGKNLSDGAINQRIWFLLKHVD